MKQRENDCLVGMPVGPGAQRREEIFVCEKRAFVNSCILKRSDSHSTPT